MRMFVLLHCIADTPKTCPDTAGHALFQRHLAGNGMISKQRGEFPDHAGRTAGVNHRVVQGKGRQIFRQRLRDESVAPHAAVVRADMDFAAERLQSAVFAPA